MPVIRSTTEAFLVSVAAAAVFFALLVAAAILLPQDQQAIRRHLVEAITSGEINAQATLGPLQRGTIDRSSLDCLIFNMMLAPPSDRAAEALSNRMAEFDSATANDPRVPPFPFCQALLRALPEFGGTGTGFIQYDRYLLGMRVLARVLLSAMPVATMRDVLLAVSYALLALIGIFALSRFRRAQDGSARAHAAGHAAIAACLALFYAVHYFDATVYFAPMDWTQYLFVLLSLALPLHTLRANALALYGASYGSLIAIFEFLTGGIPLALALLPLLLALGDRGERPYFGNLVRLWGCFCLGVVASFALKQLYAAAFLGGSEDFIANLLHRTYGDFDSGTPARYSLAFLALSYYRASWLIGWGSSLFGASLVLGALAVLALATWRRAGGTANRTVRAACWLSLFALGLWTAVFLNHAILHAVFMGRLLVVPVIAAAAMMATAASLHGRAALAS